MRIFPAARYRASRSLGHDVLWVRAEWPGAGDREVLEQAVRGKRILLTFDKDFGELARATRLPPECGVVLLRLPMPRASEAGERLAALIHRRSDWAGHFSVIEPGRLRMRDIRP